MSDLPAVSAGEPTEQAALPVPQIASEVSAGQPTSPVVDVNAIVEQVVSQLDEILDRKLQSTKDRRFADVEKVMAALNEQGGDVKKAARQLAIDQLLEQQGQVSQQPVRGGTEVEDFDERYAGILAKHSIAPDDSELAQFVSSNKFGSQKAFLDALREQAVRLKSKREKQEKPVTAASLGAGSGGAPLGEKSETELLEDYRKEMYAARGKPNDLRAVKAKYKEKGVAIENVIF